MISVVQYFAKPYTSLHYARATDLLERVNALMEDFRTETGNVPVTDPDTGTEISGSKGGAGDGGFRTPAPGNSAHQEARAVDPYDPGDRLDNWLSKFDYEGGKGNSKLEEYDLYREHPDATPGWCHLTTRAPGSGRRTFYP